MPYPSLREYFTAVQNPATSFRTNSLKAARFVLDPVLQAPQFASGENAIIFKALVDGKEQALRFFIREDVPTRERYSALGEHFHIHKLTDCVATSKWLDNAIEINGSSWPAIQMQWVEGRTLDAYVDYLVEKNDTIALTRLAGEWRNLIGRLQAACFAHGDLQHGNVLVDHTGTLRLVDFDASWILPFAGLPPPSETGHPNYQRQDRRWDQWMDTFPGLLVYTSLVTLTKDTSAWHKLYDQNNLLFQRDDLIPPCDTAAWDHIASIADEQLSDLLALLKKCCAPGWAAEGGLEELLCGAAVSSLRWWELIEARRLRNDVTSRREALHPPSPIEMTVPEPVFSWLQVPLTQGPVNSKEWWRESIPVPGFSAPPAISSPEREKQQITVLDALLALLSIGGPIALVIGFFDGAYILLTAGAIAFFAGLIPLFIRLRSKP